MSLPAALGFSGAAFGALLALAALARRPWSAAQWVFAAGMVLLAIESACAACSFLSPRPEQVLGWQYSRLISTSLLPGTWLLFSVIYSRGNRRLFLRKWSPAVGLAFLVPLTLVLGFRGGLISALQWGEAPGQWSMTLGGSGIALYVAVLLAAVLVLMNLERTFRDSIGTMRWRIKFVVLGLGVLFVCRIYTSSQSLLYTRLSPSFQVVNSGALLVAGLLVAWALARTKLFNADLYPSQDVLRNSLTILVAGVYLFIVGILAKLVTAFGGDTAFPVKAFLVLLSLVVLSVLLLSDRLQQRLRLLVSRHFQRPYHNYRKTWTLFTERTASLMEETGLCRAAAKLVAETFQVLSVTVWLVDWKTNRLVFVASTLLSDNSTHDLLPLDPRLAEALQGMRERSKPVDLDDSTEDWVEVLKQWNPDFFGKGGHRVCVPLVAGGELLGLMVAGDRVSGLQFSLEDLDLLNCMGDQVASGLLNIHLSQRLLEAKQMEAFQTMSAFFVHDLKNTASTLSLTLQNLRAHFADPAFREDALRAVSKSVSHINDLISRLSYLRQRPDTKRIEADLNEVVQAALTGLDWATGSAIEKDFQPVAGVLVDPEEIKKVVANLVLNARDAIGKDGHISLATSQRNGWAVLSVSDDGCGMTSEFMSRNLFRPFQTTKKKGIGIGMFQTKTIVEAHHGKIEVQSERGKGTTFRVLLPCTGEAK